MPRRARLILPGAPLHIIQRGNNRQACFFQERDRRRYLDWLTEYADASGCDVHAYVLMSNHVHLLLTPAFTRSAGDLMKAVGQRYTQYVNRNYGRTGSLWEGRFRSCIIQDRHYLLNCYRYIELNPVRAQMTTHPAAYPWSSHRNNAYGAHSELLRPHPLYLALGEDQPARQSAYQCLFQHELASDVIDSFRRSTNGNFVLGDTDFSLGVEEALMQRASPGRAGRPRI
ncbi:putative transposase [Duganella sp. 1224]|uniref:transposase n=1 Tax=Duganella sp. 1224 TaxID=2587052 RepID=UPI0015CD568E|nr:transposase [Duganella sp. 1224]NYE61694.1 putative transposase [Duganella sp. 1224]